MDSYQNRNEEAYTDSLHEQRKSGANYTGAVNADMNAAAAQTQMDKLHSSQGHGYAAEQANHLYDLLTGKDAALVGGNNAKDGPDRLVDGTAIQTKYYNSAYGSVGAAFDHGRYRYINPDGTPMQLEVPSDQYEKAVELMAKRIECGQVQGCTDSQDAKTLVRRGSFTYDQAQKLVKFGTIESLTYDAVNGAIICTNTMGITAVLTFAQARWCGKSSEMAIEMAMYSGIRIGGAAFVNSVICAQLMRTELPKMLVPVTDFVVDLLGPKASATLANTLRDGANIYGKAAMNNVAKLLRGNMITATVMTVVLSAQDICNAFRGRISGRQLFKNMVTTAGGIAGGTAGVFAGKFVLNLLVLEPSKSVQLLVELAGSMAGGKAGSTAANTVVGKFVEDDAVEMVRIIEGTFCRMAQAYMLTQDEVDIVVDDLSRALTGETLLNMYASMDQYAFAEELVGRQVERLVRGRCRICLPPEEEFIHGIGRLIEDSEQGTGIFADAPARREDPVEIGRRLTGRELEPQAARKGLYAAKQMNLALRQTEEKLHNMVSQEQKFQEEKSVLYQQRDGYKKELESLLGGNCT